MTASVAPKGRARPLATDEYEALAVTIRRAIVTGEYGPNQRLVEAELADALGASRAAVRAALLALANEGLVERSRFRGARVRAVSVAEAIEITEVRMMIEALCARKAAALATSSDTAGLTEVGNQLASSVEIGDLRGYSELNQELHRRIIAISGQATAALELERLRAQSVRHEFRLALVPGRVLISLREHERIIAAIDSRDQDAAESAMRAHIASVVEALRETWTGPVTRFGDAGGRHG